MTEQHSKSAESRTYSRIEVEITRGLKGFLNGRFIN